MHFRQVRVATGALLGIVLVGLVAQLWAQTTVQLPARGVEKRPTFEAVSIKPNKSGDPLVGLKIMPGGRLVGTNVTVPTLVRLAYNLRLFRLIVGGPDWIRSEHFNVETSAQGNPGFDEIRSMVQSLLADRFRFVAHPETQQLPIYALVASKPGSLPPSDAAKCSTGADGSTSLPFCGALLPSPTPITNGRHMIGRSLTIQDLIRQLDGFVDRVVIDKTNLAEKYDVDLTFATQQLLTGDATDVPPSLFTALQEQLGLKLDAQTGPVDVLVIDRVEKPSEN
jgi:uncharacterized protein (TIGR03435 family)